MNGQTNIPEIELGRINRLRIIKRVDFGYYLEGSIRGQRTEILLPNNSITEEWRKKYLQNSSLSSSNNTPLEPSCFIPSHPEGDAPPSEGQGEVFIYLDQSERIIATTEKPLAQVGDFAFLEVAWVNNFGAFLHWGLMKDLFVPFREQKMKMVKGNSYIVHVHLDEESYRIMASAKVDRYLDTGFPPYRIGDEVDILVWQKTELGLKVIVDNRFAGLLYDDQVFRSLRTGDRTKAFVSQVRPDGKLDIMLSRPGQAAVTDFSDTLLQYLKDNGGHTILGDKSPAEDIYQTFGVSKKVFKKAVGDLYKRRLITISTEGLQLTNEPTRDLTPASPKGRSFYANKNKEKKPHPRLPKGEELLF